MPLKIADDGTVKRLRGRPSAFDREFDRWRAAADAELLADLDPILETDELYFPGTQRHRRSPPLTARSAKLMGLIAGGMDEEAARVACKLQRRALRRLMATSPLFQTAIAGARAAAKVQCVAGDALGASTAVMTKQTDLRRDDEAAPLSVKVNLIDRDHPSEAK
ncbi:MAG: hypothetical protein ABSF67_00095 [Roseiarcus sp.]|jgi:hypothetical protein